MSLDFIIYDKPGEYAQHELADFNITHNLGRMAKEAGIYECLWHPNEHGMVTPRPKDIVKTLSSGIELMKEDPERFRKFDAENGWGTYSNFLPWLENVLEACLEYPNARISVSR